MGGIEHEWVRVPDQVSFFSPRGSLYGSRLSGISKRRESTMRTTDGGG